MNVTVTTLPAVLAVVDGERCICRMDTSGECYLGIPFADCAEDNKAPTEWEDIDLTCLCQQMKYPGRGMVLTRSGPPNSGVGVKPCSDCVDGHPIIDVQMFETFTAGDGDPAIRARSLRVSIQAVLIMEVGYHALSDLPEECISMWRGQLATLILGGLPVCDIALPAGARPGQWAIVATETP